MCLNSNLYQAINSDIVARFHDSLLESNFLTGETEFLYFKHR